MIVGITLGPDGLIVGTGDGNNNGDCDGAEAGG